MTNSAHKEVSIVKYWPLICLILVLLATSFIAGGCSQAHTGRQETPVIKLADQFGLGYAPLTIMLEQKFLEKHLPNIKIERLKFGSGGGCTRSNDCRKFGRWFYGNTAFLGWLGQGGGLENCRCFRLYAIASSHS